MCYPSCCDSNAKSLSLAERTGFEPAEAVNLARFPSVCLKPLDHLSKIVFYFLSPN